MSNINDLELDLYRVGADLALTNSKDLFASAELILGNNIGHATSLLILSSEEAAKAIVLFAESNNMRIDPDGVKPYLSKHKIKHELLLLLIFTSEWLSIKEDDAIKAFASMKDTNVEEFMGLFVDGANTVSDAGSVQYKNARDWLRTANNVKNSGLYVDFIDGSWVTPKKISKEFYNRSKTVVENLIKIGRLASIIDKRYSNIEELVFIRENFKKFTNAIDIWADSKSEN